MAAVAESLLLGVFGGNVKEIGDIVKDFDFSKVIPFACLPA